MIVDIPAPSTDEVYRREILTYIQRKIDEHPRSAQKQIGPSEVGSCETKVAWKLAYGGDSDREGGWAAAKGSIIHKWLDEEVFAHGPSLMPDGTQRWFSDMKLDPVVDWVNGGTLDLYDRLHETVLDWKVVGDWSMKNVRTNKLSPSYYVQANIYGYGLEKMGYPVRRVALMFLPAGTDELHGAGRGAVLKTWPYERQVAIDGLNNIKRIQNIIDVAGIAKAIEVLPKRSDFCSGCPAFLGNNDRRATCPGAEVSRPVKKVDPSNPFAS